MHYRHLSKSEYEQLYNDCEVLSFRGGKPRSFLTADNRVVKLIYKRRAGLLRWSAFFRARRFKKNVIKLAQLNIASITSIEVCYYPADRCYVAIYPKLVGTAVERYLIDNDGKMAEVLINWAEYLAHLHNKGVFFYKDLHFGNMLLDAKEDFILIDIERLRIKNRPLNLKERSHDMEMLFEQEGQRIENFGKQNFLNVYK